ncbi:glucose-6-phosphatase 3-like [Diadema antillarum]|uniref:glucose-6-phosphatase 3-like n=1 Tax=Diadema antillarum TaxID=105358 RepID=UPI003A8C3829
MEELQKSEIHFLQRLQESFSNYEGVMLTISHLGDPRNAFLLYFPIAFCFINAKAGLQVLWVAVVSEWLNAVLKWILIGQRPYWWVMESPVFFGEERPFIKQFRLTCETGPGCPSGHAMVTSAVWFVLISSINEVIVSEATPKYSHHIATVKRLMWFLFALMATVVSISRVFIATHFPHQVILGVVNGVLLGITVRKYPVENYGFGRYFLGGLFAITSVILEYYVLSYAGLNPDWSMKLALKRCVFREWVHMDTSPFYAISRDVGAFFFAGMMCSCLTLNYDPVRGHYPRRLSATLLTVAAAQVIESIHLPRSYVFLFYMLGALKYGMVAMTTIGLNQAVTYFGGSSPSS